MISCPSQGTEISACACFARLGPGRRVDSHETVYMRKSWLVPQGHPILPTEWPYPHGHPSPWARFAVSRVNGRRWFISNCRKTWLAPVGSEGRVPRVPGPTFLHITGPYKCYTVITLLLGGIYIINFWCTFVWCQCGYGESVLFVTITMHLELAFCSSVFSRRFLIFDNA